MKKTKMLQVRKVLVVMGTRPEVIKLAPVIEALRAKGTGKRNRMEKGKKAAQEKRVKFKVVICLTGQHREMVEPFLKVFGLKPDYDLRVMQPDQHLAELTGRVLAGMKKVLEAEKPDWLLVQGDTTSAMAAALAAFYQRVRIGHVEAGLRTEDKYNPFPEEINRRLISHLADWHFAPTERAKKNLLKEGIREDRILVTGNTVVDALKMILKKTKGQEWEKNLKRIEVERAGTAGGSEQRLKEEAISRDKKGEREGEEREGKRERKWEVEKERERERRSEVERESEKERQRKSRIEGGLSKNKNKKLILVTAHRRESFGKGMEGICQAILRIVEKVKEAEVIFPVHLNPNVRKVVFRYLLGAERVRLIEPVDYVTFVHLMKRASLILTDSGGIQEEAPSLGVPVVVMREKTERPEAVEAGVAWLAGTDPARIERLALWLLKKVEDREFRRGLRKKNPFGDGRAAYKTGDALHIS